MLILSFLLSREIFMSQRLLSSNNNSVKTVSFDNEFEEEDTIRMKNLESVVCSNLKNDADFVPGPSNS